MKEAKNNKSDVVQKIRFAAMLIAIVGLIFMLLFYPYYKPRKTTWCYFENNITQTTLPRNECTYIKIISKDTDKINFDKFYALNATMVGCADSYDKMPPCSGDEYYFTQIGTSALSDDINADGIMCVAYHITFYETNNSFFESDKMMYKTLNFDEQVNSTNDLKQKLLDCKVR